MVSIYFAGDQAPTPYGAADIVMPHRRSSPVRQLVEADLPVERGRMLGSGPVRQRMRYHAPRIARAVLGALIVAVAPVLAEPAIGHLEAGPGTSVLLDRVAVVVCVALWLRVAALTLAALIRSRLYSVTFHDRAMEVASGVLHRRKQLIWYFQLAAEPVYVRTPVMLLTRTASLRITYDDTAGTSRTVDLVGIGTPPQVDLIRHLLEDRRLNERVPMRGYRA